MFGTQNADQSHANSFAFTSGAYNSIAYSSLHRLSFTTFSTCGTCVIARRLKEGGGKKEKNKTTCVRRTRENPTANRIFHQIFLPSGLAICTLTIFSGSSSNNCRPCTDDEHLPKPDFIDYPIQLSVLIPLIIYMLLKL